MPNDLPTCRASQLVARIQELIAEHGDLPVYVQDADTEWSLPVGVTVGVADNIGATHTGNVFHVTTEYHGVPAGYIRPNDPEAEADAE